MSELFSDDWLREIVHRHPYAVAKQQYFFNVRTMSQDARRLLDEKAVLVILQDCVMVFQFPNGQIRALRTFAGTIWWPSKTMNIIRLDPDNDRFPSQDDVPPS